MPKTAARAKRAAPLSPDERRRAIVDAVLPLLREHGRAVTTHQIAEAADIAEGTIFRVFASKEELVDAALERAFAPGPFLDHVAAIDKTLPLRERLICFVTVLQTRFTELFALLHATGLVAPPEHLDHDEDAGTWRARLHADLVDLVGDDAARLRVPAGELIRVLRLLTFSGSHPHIADHKLMTPTEIVDLVLYGALADRPGTGDRPCC